MMAYCNARFTQGSQKALGQMKQAQWMKSIMCTAQKINFSIKYFFSKCDQIYSFLQIWSRLLKKSEIENFIFCALVSEAVSGPKMVLGEPSDIKKILQKTLWKPWR